MRTSVKTRERDGPPAIARLFGAAMLRCG